MGHSVGDAADRAVKNSEKVKLSEMTPEQLITELRKNLKAGLWIPGHQIEALLTAHDKLSEQVSSLTNERELIQTSLLTAEERIQKFKKLEAKIEHDILEEQDEAARQ